MTATSSYGCDVCTTIAAERAALEERFPYGSIVRWHTPDGDVAESWTVTVSRFCDSWLLVVEDVAGGKTRFVMVDEVLDVTPPTTVHDH